MHFEKLVNVIKGQNVITLPKGLKLYHGLRRKEGEDYFTATHWLTTDLNYAVDYAFKVDFNNKHLVTRDLLICETLQELNLVDMSGINMNSLTEMLSKDHNIDMNDRWVKDLFVINANYALDIEIHGYAKNFNSECDEILIGYVDNVLKIIKIID